MCISLNGAGRRNNEKNGLARILHWEKLVPHEQMRLCYIVETVFGLGSCARRTGSRTRSQAQIKSATFAGNHDFFLDNSNAGTYPFEEAACRCRCRELRPRTMRLKLSRS